MFSRSKHDDQWTREGDTRIVVTGSPGIGGKVFGIPWMLFGVYFIYNWVIAGVIEYIQAGDFAGLASGALVWLLVLAVLAGIFIVPGWLLAFTRRKVVVDKSKGEVEEGNDFRVLRRLRNHSLTEFTGVLVVETVSRSKDSRGNTQNIVFQDVRLSRGDPQGLCSRGHDADG
jgi:uncharacterized protein (DUF58 family)